jgi:hypothetical protein
MLGTVRPRRYVSKCQTELLRCCAADLTVDGCGSFYNTYGNTVGGSWGTMSATWQEVWRRSLCDWKICHWFGRNSSEPCKHPVRTLSPVIGAHGSAAAAHAREPANSMGMSQHTCRRIYAPAP